MYLVMIDVPRYNITACPLQIDQICRNLTKVAKVQVCDNFLRHYLVFRKYLNLFGKSKYMEGHARIGELGMFRKTWKTSDFISWNAWSGRRYSSGTCAASAAVTAAVRRCRRVVVVVGIVRQVLRGRERRLQRSWWETISICLNLMKTC